MGWCLEVLGCCESAVTGFGMDRPHTIQAAHWWGSEPVLNAILDGVAALPQREHITLDLRAPSALAQASDAMLGDCFGYSHDENTFALLAIQTIMNRHLELKGLGLIGAHLEAKPVETLGLKHAGATHQAVLAAVPADFAAFTVLSR